MLNEIDQMRSNLRKVASIGSLNSVSYFHALKVKSSSLRDIDEIQNKLLAIGLKSSVQNMLQNMIVRSKSSNKDLVKMGKKNAIELSN